MMDGIVYHRLVLSKKKELQRGKIVLEQAKTPYYLNSLQLSLQINLVFRLWAAYFVVGCPNPLATAIVQMYEKYFKTCNLSI